MSEEPQVPEVTQVSEQVQEPVVVAAPVHSQWRYTKTALGVLNVHGRPLVNLTHEGQIVDAPDEATAEVLEKTGYFERVDASVEDAPATPEDLAAMATSMTPIVEAAAVITQAITPPPAPTAALLPADPTGPAAPTPDQAASAAPADPEEHA
ncbi:hypothetical protein MF271_19365 (plasmid) [Deinococcus sp. KNUC1210]|uniref:hypothetical protein n=1 Tax=Deinococcus sp. KNUC1210 TaxID=2917691 RepID=UPI001EEF9788|nr:hypothetical protein [Deinococcus sp. KNUC1210]ULH17351.1 hypothetical protein MF271_19365 [Deinococcus sp. KNUC1210]